MTAYKNQVNDRKHVPEVDIQSARAILAKIKSQYERNIVGQRELLLKILVGLVAKGHILLEGVPGLAKTRSIKVVSGSVSGDFSRIQFTPDLLPSDIVGNLIFNPKTAEFSIKKGPVFANFVLADEVNRSPAKVQSALLEAMQEKQTTIGETTFKLPKPFFVLATQNPIEQEGTYPLPEAQVDRFLLKTVVDYPKIEDEVEIMNLIEKNVEEIVDSTVSLKDLLFVQQISSQIYADDRIKSYISKIIFATRKPEDFDLKNLKGKITVGASPRGSIGFLLASKALALISGRDHVIPEDIKSLRYDILRHRIILSFEAEAEGVKVEDIIDEIFNSIQVP